MILLSYEYLKGIFCQPPELGVRHDAGLRDGGCDGPGVDGAVEGAVLDDEDGGGDGGEGSGGDVALKKASVF